MDILLVITVGTISIVSFFIGARLGQKVAKGEAIEMPNPFDIAEERKEKREAKAEKTRNDIIMSNIDNYNGTDVGQRDVPR